MTIQSYIVYPEPGQGPLVAETLHRLSGVSEVIAAENREILVLITETPGKDEQNGLEQALEGLDGVACLAMVGGWTE